MKWCCDQFRLHYDHRHERGVIVYVLPPVAGAPSEPLFRLGFRALERSRYASLSESFKGTTEGCISLEGSTSMRCCPWCGSTLTEFYRSTWQELLDVRITDEFRWTVT